MTYFAARLSPTFLGVSNMGLGDNPAGFAFIEKAMAGVPIEKDAMDGPDPNEILSRLFAQMGEPEHAVSALQKLLSIPYDGPMAAHVLLTPALRLDPLRSDPRFQKLVESSKLNTADK